MRLISWNLWHGLSGAGLLEFGELESPQERRDRYKKQIELLSRASFDFFCAQEVNPLPARVDQFEDACGAQSISCFDNSGLKYKGFGFPRNLNSGLAIFYRAPWECVYSEKIQLSGSWSNWQTDLFSNQYRESRYALIGRFRRRKDNNKDHEFLLVNLHLHHGFQWQDEVITAIEKSVDGLSEEQWDNLREILARGDLRRTQELVVLLERLREFEDLPTVIVGDFNADPGSPAHRDLVQSGFNDMWGQLNSQDPGLTWNAKANPQIFEKLKDFKSDLQFDPELFTKEQRQELRMALAPFETRPRRIDHVFLRDSDGRFFPQSIALYANKPETIASDHFGLEFEVEDGELE